MCSQCLILRISCQAPNRFPQDSQIFRPGIYQDLARPRKIIHEIQDSHQEIQESRNPTSIYNDKTIPDFFLNFPDAVPDFPGFFKIQDSHQENQESRNPTSVYNDKTIPDFFEIFRMQSQIFQDFSRSSRIIRGLQDCFLMFPICKKIV